MQRTKGQGDKMSNTTKQSKTRRKRIRTKYPKLKPILEPFDLNENPNLTKPLFCKKHNQWYMPWLNDCPICAGEKMSPAMKRESQ